MKLNSKSGESIKYPVSVVMNLGGIDNASDIGDMIDEYISVYETLYGEYHRKSLNELYKAYRENSKTKLIAMEKMRNFLKSQIRKEQLKKLI